MKQLTWKDVLVSVFTLVLWPLTLLSALFHLCLQLLKSLVIRIGGIETKTDRIKKCNGGITPQEGSVLHPVYRRSHPVVEQGLKILRFNEVHIVVLLYVSA